MKKKLYERRCNNCNKVFRSDREKKRLCPACEKARKKEIVNMRKKFIKKPPKAAELSLEKVCSLLDAYNKKNGAYMSYGQFVALWEAGKITEDDCYS